LEMRAAALRFGEAEVAAFLQAALGDGVSATAVRTLHQRTEGWIAGLQLAAIAMQSMGAAREQFVADFSGSHRFVLDYLLEEVLARQPETVRRFLLQTSVLARLNGALCGAVAAVADGQGMLTQLERDNLFVVPLDQTRQWYRYHHLFADLLQARLQAEMPEMVGELRRRAAVWHE
ncbi:MAG: helix-turn-helix transcriptional regulator, partial [Anaerolineae bacterium]|nr:helix-turn-helix transcriptional regulator [Anaerolineae bacterium]